MSENKDTLAAGRPAEFRSPPCPINAAFMHIFLTCAPGFLFCETEKDSEQFVQKPVDKSSELICELQL